MLFVPCSRQNKEVKKLKKRKERETALKEQ